MRLRLLQVLKAHLELRAAYVAAGKISHDRLFFLEDGSAISDPEVTRWRWNESLQKLGIRQRGPYHARHSSVTWALMLGKNLLWVAKRWDCSRPGTAARPPLPSGPPRLGRGVQKSLRDFCRTRLVDSGHPGPRPAGALRASKFAPANLSSTHPAPAENKKAPLGPFIFSGGEGGIRTHVPELPDHPISSRRRYDHFGTSPVNLKFFAFT